MHFYQMHENRVKIDKKGRIVIPVHIRNKFGIEEFLKLEPAKVFNSNALNLIPFFGEVNEKKDSNRN